MFQNLSKPLISTFIYKISRFVQNKIIIPSAILDIHIYRQICVTSQPGKSFAVDLGDFLVIHVVLLFSASN